MFDKLEKDFSKSVEKHVRDNDCGYIDAVVEICNELEIEPALGAKYLSIPIKEKIRVEGEEINLLPRTPKLWATP
tara:strand:+ start:434 stop:658 length:225 start_codon:yes stop_codon:yes gene_type:complete